MPWRFSLCQFRTECQRSSVTLSGSGLKRRDLGIQTYLHNPEGKPPKSYILHLRCLSGTLVLVWTLHVTESKNSDFMCPDNHRKSILMLTCRSLSKKREKQRIWINKTGTKSERTVYSFSHSCLQPLQSSSYAWVPWDTLASSYTISFIPTSVAYVTCKQCINQLNFTFYKLEIVKSARSYQDLDDDMPGFLT